MDSNTTKFGNLNLKTTWLGLLDYEAALVHQSEAADRVRRGGEAEILAMEHPTVITLGKRGQPLTDILASMEALRGENIKIVATDRGGQATLHNPGQLVLYPILPLRRWGLGVRDYVECLERATAHFLAEFGMDLTRGYEPGLFVGGCKIASFGIRVDRGVTLHGVAINVSNKVDAFSLIRQCGMTVAATNLQKEMEEFISAAPQWDFPALAEKWLQLFSEELNILAAHWPERAPELGPLEPQTPSA